MRYAILDCYTDEPSGLGVPPSLGTYPRYLFGALSKEHEVFYLTIDDLRLMRKFNSIPQKTKESRKTDISVHNLTKNYRDAEKILSTTDTIVVVAGVQTPGKYLSAIPATLKEAALLVSGLSCNKVLTGPAATECGTGSQGGHAAEKQVIGIFDEIDPNYYDINEYNMIAKYAPKGAMIARQIPYPFIAELETGKGCNGKCSFCTEPIKNKIEYRNAKDIVNEISALYREGVRHFRYGKQSCFYSYQNGNANEISKLLKPVREQLPEIKVLHIDNVNPINVLSKNGIEITKLIVRYCTEGNVAAFGVESFDKFVIKENSLNSTPELVYEAVKAINCYGANRGENGLPKYLPGINLIFGLKGETKKTFEENYTWLKKIYDDGLLLRRINIREVVPYRGTKLFENNSMTIRKNHKFYYSAREKIRQEIDFPMLSKITPKGTILKNVHAEIYDGKTTFARQIGTYPLVVGIHGRIELGKFYDIEVTGHMLRSITGKVVN